MPLYEYRCEECATKFERIQKYSDPPVDACPACNGRVKKLFSSPAIHFKGSGWYITDYAKKGGAGKEKEAKDGKAESSAGAGATSSTDSSSSGKSSESSSSGDKSSASGGSSDTGERGTSAKSTSKD